MHETNNHLDTDLTWGFTPEARLDDRYVLGYAFSPVDDRTWPVIFDTQVQETRRVPLVESDFQWHAPHEMTGTLPRSFSPTACGAITSTGTRCKAGPLTGGDGRCQHHQGKEWTPRVQ